MIHLLNPHDTLSQCAVLVDAENLGNPSFLEQVLREVRPYGERFLLNAFGVVESHREAYLEHGFNIRDHLHGFSHKNLVDMQLSIQAIEIALTSKNCNTFAIVSSDGDYIPLAKRLTELGKQVLSISGASEPNKDLLSYVQRSIRINTRPFIGVEDFNIWIERIRDALLSLLASSRKGEINLGRLGQAMMEKHSFSPSKQIGITWKNLVNENAEQLDCFVSMRNGSVWLRPIARSHFADRLTNRS